MRRPRAALLRGVSSRWSRALRQDADLPADLDQARAQHRAYSQLLVQLGVAVVCLPAGADPDGCFTEDAAVVLGRHALATRPGASSRRAEVQPVARALAGLGCIVHRMGAPATLEGGDVLRVGSRLFVGESLRSNGAGIDALARVAALEGLTTHPVALPDQMHLKGAVTLADAHTAVVDPHLLDPAVVSGWGLDVVLALETVGANVLPLGGRHLAVPLEAPRTNQALAARGFALHPLPGTAFHAADGRLTCLSLRLQAPGGWSA